MVVKLHTKPQIKIIDYYQRQPVNKRKLFNFNLKKGVLVLKTSGIKDAMPSLNELNELCRQLKKKLNPFWGKINKTQAKLEVALKELEEVSKEIKSLLLDQGHLLKTEERANFQISQEKATESIKYINFLLDQINAKRLPDQRKQQKQQSLGKYNEARVTELLAKIREQKLLYK